MARNFQEATQTLTSAGESVLLVAPTGIGKTRAVCGDLGETPRKTVYAVPLRALGTGIKHELSKYRPDLSPVIHHGDSQCSELFKEEAIVTTYDQVVCGVPGLPLSLPLKSGHAIAGALLMSRLVLDEAHLAWGISAAALPILLAIVDFRLRLGIQTIVLTATLPEAIAAQLQNHFHLLKLVIVGRGAFADDERLQKRDKNRVVSVSALALQKGKDTAPTEKKGLDWSALDKSLTQSSGKRIYFANTVERLQATYDRLIGEGGVDPNRITILHNRMPRNWRQEAERVALNERFGKCCPEGDWILLTNQVAEAGLDISAPLVISDPAPVDTLVQRAGRCARWFEKAPVEGRFLIVEVPKAHIEDIARPYRRTDFVEAALKSAPSHLSWESELKWVNESWGGAPDKAKKAVEDALNQTAFALNLFDRASQSRSPGAIAEVFREILSVEIAVHPTCSESDLAARIRSQQRPQTSTVTLGRARALAREAPAAKIIRYDDGDLKILSSDHVQLGDVLVVPPSVAYLDAPKGLCFGDGTESSGLADDRTSEWEADPSIGATLSLEGGRRQTLLSHLQGVMRGVRQRFTGEDVYRKTLRSILSALEPDRDSEALTEAVAQISTLAAGFHDLGKADVVWQKRATEIDPDCGSELVGRTAIIGRRIGHPHTPPAFLATVKACELLLGVHGPTTHLVRAIALAAARHHSSLLNPALVWIGDGPYRFKAHPDAEALVRSILQEANAPESVIARAGEIISAAETTPEPSEIPLALPNDDVFPIYALVGRAILMADREDAAGKSLNEWRR